MFFNISQVSCSRLCNISLSTLIHPPRYPITMRVFYYSCDSNRPFSLVGCCFPNTYHVTFPRRFEPLSCSLERLRASMKMSNFESQYSPGDLYWQNKIDKPKRSMYLTETIFVNLNEHRKKIQGAHNPFSRVKKVLSPKTMFGARKF